MFGSAVTADRVSSSSRRFPSVTFCPVIPDGVGAGGDYVGKSAVAFAAAVENADDVARTVVHDAYHHVNQT